MSYMQPLIVLTENDNEIWFPSWERLADYYRELFPECKARPESFRCIKRRRNYGRRNHFRIKYIWLSNFDKEKLD